jgi:thymidylate synthase
MNQTDRVWKQLLEACYTSDLKSQPRGLEISEIIGAQYRVPMPAYITLINRKVNYSFMFAEAWWILSGSNRVEDIDPYMKFYKTFSDDGIFMRGAYGPKIVDQLGYIVDTLSTDLDSRQAVVNIWRERPGSSKDIPCTLSMQFIIRKNKLNCVTTMRSNDIVKGFTYDVFTFSMISLYIKHLLSDRGIKVDLGDLIVNAGSLHLYQPDYSMVNEWMFELDTIDDSIKDLVDELVNTTDHLDLVESLKQAADEL